MEPPPAEPAAASEPEPELEGGQCRGEFTSTICCCLLMFCFFLTVLL